MKKFLMVATVPSMIGQFNIGNLQLLLSLGYEVHVACNFLDRSVWTEERVEIFRQQMQQMNIKTVQVDFARTPYDIAKLVKSYSELHKLILQEKYAALHCHTPVAGMIARLAAFRTGTKVIYTAHGFHFFKGAPVKNWIIFYPIEKICAHMTDILITINKEDYLLAREKMKAKQVVYVPGVGVDLDAFSDRVERDAARQSLGCRNNDFMLLSVGELNTNKNHKIVIQALSEIKDKVQFKYYIVGQGALKEQLQEMIDQSGLTERVKLLGFRRDVDKLLAASDVFLFPSLREGLSVALMEAMASGLPVICSNIRGNCDLIQDGQGGYLVEKNRAGEFADRIKALVGNEVLRNKMSVYNRSRIEQFSRQNVQKKMKSVYSSLFQDSEKGNM